MKKLLGLLLVVALAFVFVSFTQPKQASADVATNYESRSTYSWVYTKDTCAQLASSSYHVASYCVQDANAVEFNGTEEYWGVSIKNLSFIISRIRLAFETTSNTVVWMGTSCDYYLVSDAGTVKKVSTTTQSFDLPADFSGYVFVKKTDCYNYTNATLISNNYKLKGVRIGSDFRQSASSVYNANFAVNGLVVANFTDNVVSDLSFKLGLDDVASFNHYFLTDTISDDLKNQIKARLDIKKVENSALYPEEAVACATGYVVTRGNAKVDGSDFAYQSVLGDFNASPQLTTSHQYWGIRIENLYNKVTPIRFGFEMGGGVITWIGATGKKAYIVPDEGEPVEVDLAGQIVKVPAGFTGVIFIKKTDQYSWSTDSANNMVKNLYRAKGIRLGYNFKEAFDAKISLEGIVVANISKNGNTINITDRKLVNTFNDTRCTTQIGWQKAITDSANCTNIQNAIKNEFSIQRAEVSSFAHTCAHVCPVCSKCLDADCLDRACVKCAGHKLGTPTVTLANNVASWTAVSDADSYDVYVNGTLVGNQTELSYTVNDTDAGNYVVKVVAKAEEAYYIASDASEEVTYHIHGYENKVSYAEIANGKISTWKECACGDKIEENSAYINVYDLAQHINKTTPFKGGDTSSYSFDPQTATITVNAMTTGAQQWCRLDFHRNGETSYKYAYVIIKGAGNGINVGVKFDSNNPNNKYDGTNGNKQYKGVGENTIVVVWDLETLGMDSKLLDKIVFWPYSSDSTTGAFQVLGAGLFNTNEGTEKVTEHVFSTEWSYNEQGHAHACICGETKNAAQHSYQDKISYAEINNGKILTWKECECGSKIEEKTTYINVYDMAEHILKSAPFATGNAQDYSFDAQTATVTINKMTTAASQWCRIDFVRNGETSYKYAYIILKGNTAGLNIGAKVDTKAEGSIENNKYDGTANNKQYKGLGENTIVIVWDLETLGINSKDLAKVVFWPYSSESTTGSFQVLGGGLFNTNEGTEKVSEHVYSSEWSYTAQGHAHACICGATKDAAQHDLVDDAKVPASCLEDGKEAGKHCSVCAYTEGGATISALNHDLIDDAAIPATCTTTGKEAGKHCSRCEYTEGGAEIAMLAHNLVDDAAIPATCTTTGKEAGKHCADCSYTEGGAEIAMVAHELVDDAAVPATCGQDGKEAGKHCANCSYTEGGATVSKTGNHTYGEWVTVKESTTTVAGKQEKTCSVCGDKISENLPLLEVAEVKSCGGAILTTVFTTITLMGCALVLLKKKND